MFIFGRRIFTIKRERNAAVTSWRLHLEANLFKFFLWNIFFDFILSKFFPRSGFSKNRRNATQTLLDQSFIYYMFPIQNNIASASRAECSSIAKQTTSNSGSSPNKGAFNHKYHILLIDWMRKRRLKMPRKDIILSLPGFAIRKVSMLKS